MAAELYIYQVGKFDPNLNLKCWGSALDWNRIYKHLDSLTVAMHSTSWPILVATFAIKGSEFLIGEQRDAKSGNHGKHA